MTNLTQRSPMWGTVLSKLGLLGLSALSLLLMGCAQGYSTRHTVVPAFDRSNAATALSQASPAAAPLVIVRPASYGGDKPVNVYVNDRFVTSLAPASYVSVQACPGTLRLAAVEGDAQQRHEGRLRNWRETSVVASQKMVFEVQASPSGAQLQPSALLPEQLGEYRRQAHTLNRSRSC